MRTVVENGRANVFSIRTQRHELEQVGFAAELELTGADHVLREALEIVFRMMHEVSS